MARRRMIDPNFWMSEDVSKLNIFERLLLIGMFSNADDEGKGRASLTLLRSMIFPYDDITLSAIEDAMGNIKSRINVITYEVNDSAYYKFTNWNKWQRVDKPQPSLIPDEGENDSKNDSENDSCLKEKKRKEDNVKEINTSKESGGSDFNIFLYMQQHGFVSISPSLMEKINTDIEIYSLEEVKMAIDIADSNGKHTYNYVKGVLEHRRSGVNDKLDNQKKVEQAMKEFLEDSSI